MHTVFRSMVKNFRAFLQLSRLERKMLFRASWRLPLMSCALRLLGLEKCQSLLIKLAGFFEAREMLPIEDLLAAAQAAARMVEIAARRSPCRARCLQKSLVLWWLIRRQGIRGNLWFGIRKEGNGLEAHAWVEFSGVNLNGPEDLYQKFAAFQTPLSSAGIQYRHVQQSAI